MTADERPLPRELAALSYMLVLDVDAAKAAIDAMGEEEAKASWLAGVALARLALRRLNEIRAETL